MLCIRARLQSCRKCRKINWALAPEGKLIQTHPLPFSQYQLVILSGGKEAAFVSGKEAAFVSGKEAAFVSGKEAAFVSGKEAAFVSGKEAAFVSGKEAAFVSGHDFSRAVNAAESMRALAPAENSIRREAGVSTPAKSHPHILKTNQRGEAAFRSSSPAERFRNAGIPRTCRSRHRSRIPGQPSGTGNQSQTGSMCASGC
jgi:hypothetical protein